MNTFGYVSANPLGFIDPWGLYKNGIPYDPGIEPVYPEAVVLPAVRMIGVLSRIVPSQPVGECPKEEVPKSATRTKKVEPIKDANGLHTTWKSDPQTGEITRHETWSPNPRNPNGWDKVQSTDLKGAPHINKQTGEAVPTPHTQGKGILGGVRPADPSEIPKGNHYNY